MANLTSRCDLINECADPNGQHDAPRNQVPTPSDPGNDRLPVRGLSRVLALRLDPASTVVSRDGGAHRPRGPEVEPDSACSSRYPEEIGE